MDNFEEIKPDLPEEDEVEALWVSEDVRSYIYETSKWARFLSIVGFVFSGLTVINAFGAGAMLSTMAAMSPGNPLVKIGSAGLTIVFLLFALLQFYPSLQLYKFSAASKQAVLFADQESFSTAMGKLKSFFKFWGIATVIFISFYILMILAVIAGLAVAGRGV
jgi:hypothetical protein